MKRLILLCGLLAASCGAPSTAYIQGDRETFDSVGTDYVRYVTNDAALTQEAKDRRLLVIETWRIRLEAAEGK